MFLRVPRNIHNTVANFKMLQDKRQFEIVKRYSENVFKEYFKKKFQKTSYSSGDLIT